MFLIGVPLLIIPFAIYNIIAFLLPGLSWAGTLFSINMPSGGAWAMTLGDLIVVIGIFMLFLEILKATRIGIRTVIDHSLSLILFLAMGVEFVLIGRASTSTFFLLLVISFVDVLAGFAVTLRTAQRDLAIEGVDRLTS